MNTKPTETTDLGPQLHSISRRRKGQFNGFLTDPGSDARLTAWGRGGGERSVSSERLSNIVCTIYGDDS